MYPNKLNTPEIINASCATYIMIRGQGAWNDSNGTYASATKILRNVHKSLSKHSEFFDSAFTHSPLETFWWQNGALEIDLDDKESFIWAAAMQVGNIDANALCIAKQETEKNTSFDCSNVFLYTMVEGKCVQIRHAGNYDNEKEVVAIMKRFIDSKGLKASPYGFCSHHEIYIPLKEVGKRGQWETIFRCPVCAK